MVCRRGAIRAAAPSHAKPGVPRSYRVVLTRDSPRFLWFGWALALLLVGPLVSYLRTSGFESSRWSESNLGSDD